MVSTFEASLDGVHALWSAGCVASSFSSQMSTQTFSHALDALTTLRSLMTRGRKVAACHSYTQARQGARSAISQHVACAWTSDCNSRKQGSTRTVRRMVQGQSLCQNNEKNAWIVVQKLPQVFSKKKKKTEVVFCGPARPKLTRVFSSKKKTGVILGD